MDDLRFDTLTRGFAEIGWSRRHLSRMLVGSALVALFGWDPHETAAKRKRRKKKKKKAPAPGCTPTCTGKSCGDADGCGGSCTTQQGCGSGATCVNGQCIQGTCDPICTGNHLCQNGSCVCPPGLKECGGPGYFGNCHECCIDAIPSAPDAECVGNLGGEYCRDDDGDLIYRCGCFPGERNCGDGQCVVCCTHQHCRERFNDEFRICVDGTCPCNEAAGFFECPDGSFLEGLCRHISDDANACGPNCDRCDPPRSICAGGKCCFPAGESCQGNHRGCCSGEDNCGPGFVCS